MHLKIALVSYFVISYQVRSAPRMRLGSFQNIYTNTLYPFLPHLYSANSRYFCQLLANGGTITIGQHRKTCELLTCYCLQALWYNIYVNTSLWYRYELDTIYLAILITADIMLLWGRNPIQIYVHFMDSHNQNIFSRTNIGACCGRPLIGLSALQVDLVGILNSYKNDRS